MKKFLLLLPVHLLLFGAVGSAQITVNSADMPVSGDTIRMSNGLAFTGMDATLTGADYVWDYSKLTSVTQTIDTFLSVYSTNILYSAVFGLFGKNYSTVAERGVSIGVPGFSISGVFNFYNNSSSRYEQTGFGASVNGVPAPITYSPHDTIYHFPLNYGKVDSSYSRYSVSLPTLFSYTSKSFRLNEADGWGSLTTPYGTFSVLRVKSTIISNDSIYIDTLGNGFAVNNLEQIEYKWLGKGQGEPLLQINTTGGVVTQIIYRDSIRNPFNVGTTLFTESLESGPFVYPNPSASFQSIIYSLKEPADVKLEVYNMTGTKIATLADEHQAADKHLYALNVGSENFSSGIYLLRLSVNGKSYLQKLVVTK